jgi:hypothetical protein
MWKNIVEPDRPQMTLWRMLIACWKTKATDTHSEYVVHAFPGRELFQERTSKLRYTYSACLVISCYLHVGTCEQFSELHNNVVEHILIFRCNLHLCQLSSATSLCRIFRCREFETVLNFTQFFVILPVC